MLLLDLLQEWDLCSRMAHHSHIQIYLVLTLMAAPLDLHPSLVIMEMVVHRLVTLVRVVVDQEEVGEEEAVHPSDQEGVIGAYLETGLQVLAN